MTTARGRHGDDPPSWRRRRWTRLIIRAAQLIGALVALAGITFGVLLLVTPSVGNARQVAEQITRAHHAAYPGPAVPHKFATALEATEDHRFNEEPGIDPIAVTRLAFDEVTGKGDQGGATLYAQLAKMLYTPGDDSFSAQVEQGVLAFKLWMTYSGPEILRLYSDVAYFGNGFYGLQAASCGYFGVQPSSMSWPQAAMLAGLVQGPTVDDPLKFPAHAIAREQHVIGRLVATGALTSDQANAYLSTTLRALVAGAGGCH
jgi:membrane peptidoglycan carboxypeptidase